MRLVDNLPLIAYGYTGIPIYVWCWPLVTNLTVTFPSGDLDL